MNRRDLPDFSKELLKTYAILNKTVQPLENDKIEIYYDCLQEYSIDEIIASLKICQKECQFFPVPKDIIEKIEGKENEIIDIAFMNAKKAVDYIGFHDSIVFKDKLITASLKDIGLQNFYDLIFRKNDEKAAYFQFKRGYKKYLSLQKKGGDFTHIRSVAGYTELLPGGGLFWIAFWDEDYKGRKQYIPEEYKQLIASNREWLASIPGYKKLTEGEKIKPKMMKKSAESIDELLKEIENEGVKKT
jgi:hypothetical protein